LATRGLTRPRSTRASDPPSSKRAVSFYEEKAVRILTE
jgi:hypothetical protein